MIKKLIICVTFLSNYSYAQNCENVNIDPQIVFDIKKLKIEKEKSVGYLQQKNTKDNHFPLGVYEASKSIEILPEYSVRKNTLSNNTCAEIKNLKIVFTMEPIIYISKESQQFSCTYSRVYNHEITHYNIEINAINKVSPYLRNLINEVYSPAINASGNQNLHAQIDARNKKIIKQVFDKIVEYTEPYHAQIDTQDNYEKESKLCSNLENATLNSWLNGNRNLGIFK